jgi:hypothetical protein
MAKTFRAIHGAALFDPHPVKGHRPRQRQRASPKAKGLAKGKGPRQRQRASPKAKGLGFASAPQQLSATRDRNASGDVATTEPPLVAHEWRKSEKSNQSFLLRCGKDRFFNFAE